jgi:hypothetical protein
MSLFYIIFTCEYILGISAVRLESPCITLINNIENTIDIQILLNIPSNYKYWVTFNGFDKFNGLALSNNNWYA